MVLISLTKMRSGISKRFDEEYKDRLFTIIGGEKVYSSDDKLMELLRGGAVLEYNCEHWVDVHPLVREWLEDNEMLTQNETGSLA